MEVTFRHNVRQVSRCSKWMSLEARGFASAPWRPLIPTSDNGRQHQKISAWDLRQPQTCIRRRLTRPSGSTGQDFLRKETSDTLNRTARGTHIAHQRTAELLGAPIPSDEATLATLKAVEDCARAIAEPPSSSSNNTQNPTSSILELDARPAQPAAIDAEIKEETIKILEKLALTILTHPPVFITPQLLEVYVKIQSLLQRPEPLPSVFNLYRTKPVPKQSRFNSGSVAYTSPSPNAIAMAIPAKLANEALDAAILAHDLPTALAIVTSTFRMPSYRRSKIFRKALPPFLGACLVPVAAWQMATGLAATQADMPAEDFANIAFAGILTYAGAVGTLGYVALTTANDQMERVTWMVGTRLWERWVREEERAACDRIAKAWGFKDKMRWGEEEGPEWLELKDWLGYRGMILDNVELMEGME